MSKVVDFPRRATRQRFAQLFSRALREHAVADAPDDYEEVMESLHLPPSRDRILLLLGALAVSSALSLKLLAAISAATFALATSSPANVHQLNFAAGSPDGDLVGLTANGPWTATDAAATGARGQMTGMSGFAGADGLLVAIGDHMDFGGASVSAALGAFGSGDNGSGQIFVTSHSANPGGAG